MATLIEMEARLKKSARKNKNGYEPLRLPQTKQAAYQAWKVVLIDCIKRAKIIKAMQG
jgi:hypothetical protein